MTGYRAQFEPAMRAALAEAAAAGEDVPVGAVVLDDSGAVIARGRNQRFRIRGRFKTGAKDRIVAGGFLLMTQAPGEVPHEGMKPVDGAGQVSHQTGPEIFSFHMRPFMSQSGGALRQRPGRGGAPPGRWCPWPPNPPG